MTKKASNTPLSKELAQAFIDKGHSLYDDEGTLEVDHEPNDPVANVSTGENIGEILENGGLYVKAWVWVRVNDLSEEEQIKFFGQIVD